MFPPNVAPNQRAATPWRHVVALGLLALAGCGSSSSDTVPAKPRARQVTTKTTETPARPRLASFDPDTSVAASDARHTSVIFFAQGSDRRLRRQAQRCVRSYRARGVVIACYAFRSPDVIHRLRTENIPIRSGCWDASWNRTAEGRENGSFSRVSSPCFAAVKKPSPPTPRAPGLAALRRGVYASSRRFCSSGPADFIAREYGGGQDTFAIARAYASKVGEPGQTFEVARRGCFDGLVAHAAAGGP